MSLKQKINLMARYVLPQKLLTKVVGYMANSRTFACWFIPWFAKHYQVDMSDAIHADYKAYPTFNAFFTRQLKPGARVIAHSALNLTSPADGVISEQGVIENERLIQAKGKHFMLKDLLANAQDAIPFQGGIFSTIYLSPKDYHRVHFPCDAKVTKMRYIPGKLFSVSPFTANHVDNLFAKNERLCIFLETPLGPMVLVMVGAMIVAGMSTTWSGDISRSDSLCDWSYDKTLCFKQGDELGAFKLGSTVIMIWQNQALELIESHDSAIQMGQVLAKVHQ